MPTPRPAMKIDLSADHAGLQIMNRSVLIVWISIAACPRVAVEGERHDASIRLPMTPGIVLDFRAVRNQVPCQIVPPSGVKTVSKAPGQIIGVVPLPAEVRQFDDQLRTSWSNRVVRRCPSVR